MRCSTGTGGSPAWYSGPRASFRRRTTWRRPASPTRRTTPRPTSSCTGGWTWSLDRVYVNARARADLGWEPVHDFAALLCRLRRAEDPRSPLARRVGSKGYHGYEDYTSTSTSHDQTRRPFGVERILALMARGGLDPARTRLLDAGCGTGSYLAALRHRLAALEGLEPDPGMLGAARRKLPDAEAVALHQGSILAMPFADRRFDAVMINQVLHHLDAGDAAGDAPWANLRQALAECRRVLRRGGVLVINTCTQDQVRDGAWYNALVPEAVARVARRYAPLETLVALLSEHGFEDPAVDTPLDEVFFGPRYLDPAGPFDPAWRSGDSLWSLATPAELEAGLARLGALRAAGAADDFLRARDRLRQAAGQAVLVSARRC